MKYALRREASHNNRPPLRAFPKHKDVEVFCLINDKGSTFCSLTTFTTNELIAFSFTRQLSVVPIYYCKLSLYHRTVHIVFHFRYVLPLAIGVGSASVIFFFRHSLVSKLNISNLASSFMSHNTISYIIFSKI